MIFEENRPKTQKNKQDRPGKANTKRTETEPTVSGAPNLEDWTGTAVEFAEQWLDFHPDATQKEVLEDSIRRGLLNCTRQWGKSTVTAVKALYRAWTRPGSVILVVSPTERQSAEHLRKTEGFVRKLGIKPKGDGDNRLSILLPNQSRIIGLPSNEGGTRGFSAVTLLLIDEASRVTDPVYRAMRPSLAVANGDLWLLSTPHGEGGFFWQEWTKGGDVWQRFSIKATDCPRIPKDFLEEERDKLGEQWYRQEYMCEFTAKDESLISRKHAERAFDSRLQPLALETKLQRPKQEQE